MVLAETFALDDFDDADHGQLGDPPGLDDGPVGGGERVEPLDERIARRGDPDQAYAYFIAKDVLLGGDLRSDGDLESLLPSRSTFRDSGRSVALVNDLRQVFPALDGGAVDLQDAVAFLQARLVGRVIRFHLPHLRKQGGHAGHEDDGEGDDGKEKVEEGPGEDDAQALAHGLSRKGFGQISSGGNLLPRLLPDHLHVPPQGNERNLVLGFADLSSRRAWDRTPGRK